MTDRVKVMNSKAHCLKKTQAIVTAIVEISPDGCSHPTL